MQQQQNIKREIDQVDDNEDASSEKKTRLPKKRVAIMFGYNGKNYQGSQINPKMKTIEGQLLNAFFRAGCISQENSSDPSKVGLQRAARTDANVHACCNLISLKLILNPTSLNNSKYNNQQPQTNDGDKASSETDCQLESLHSELMKDSEFLPLTQHINQFLPPEIRIWNLVRVQNSFNCRSYCDSRVYEYSFPTWCFLPPKPGTWLHTRLSNQIQKLHHQYESEQPHEFNWWKNSKILSNDDDDNNNKSFKKIQFETKKNYRISQFMMNKVNSILDHFKGTHNFHNFTVGQSFHQANSTRIMKNLKLSEPFLVPLPPLDDTSKNSDDSLLTEWISITFHGQSFMLHQIRKMVGLIILMCRTSTPIDIIKELYGPKKVRIPKAPGIGLILKKVNFDGYNQQINKKTNSKKTTIRKKNDDETKNQNQNQNQLKEQDNLLIWKPIDSNPFQDLFEKFKSLVLVKQIYSLTTATGTEKKTLQSRGLNVDDDDLEEIETHDEVKVDKKQVFEELVVNKEEAESTTTTNQDESKKPQVNTQNEEEETGEEEKVGLKLHQNQNHLPHPVLKSLNPSLGHLEDPFGVWINYMDVYTGSDLDFLNPNGIVPES